MTEHFWLLPVGVLLGALGTLIGAGGGFLLMPLLLLVYPNESPELLTGISLATVFFNAASGSYAYAKKKRIDYASAWVFALAALPGATVGAWLIAYVPLPIFRVVFGGMMLLGGLSLVVRAGHADRPRPPSPKADVHRHLVDAEGKSYDWSYRRITGVGLASIVGVLSSMLGIGGGIIHVPAMVNLLSYPVHLATATSHLVLCLTALAGLLVRLGLGTLEPGFGRTIMLGVGAVVGAQLGARLSDKVKGPGIIRALAVALMLVGVRILWHR